MRGSARASLVETAREAEEIDGIGFNCGVGPPHLARVLRRLDFGDLIVSAAPNAGYADRIRYRNIYRDNLEYFGQALEEIAGLGVNIIAAAAARTRPISAGCPRRRTKGSPGGRRTGRRRGRTKRCATTTTPLSEGCIPERKW